MGNYIIRNGQLMHWGVPGMKWGIRRYQNKDGTLTPAGKKRYDKEMAKAKAEQKIVKNRERTQAKVDKLNALRADTEARKKALDGKDDERSLKDSLKSKHQAQKAKKKTIKEMTDEELQAKIDRMNLEKRYKDLMKEQHPDKQKSSKGKAFAEKIFDRTIEDMAPQVTKHYAAKLLNNLIGDKDSDGKVIERVFANNKKKS